MKILVDAHGGDNAPLEIIKACIRAEKEPNTNIVLCGIRDEIEETADRYRLDISAMEILPAEAVLDMHAKASSIVREGRNTSMAVGLQALKSKEYDAFVSAGNSGGLIAGALLLTGRLPHAKRAAMAPMIPTAKGRKLLLDAGANIECKPDVLQQFAVMGSTYLQYAKHMGNPRVGLLNVGTESTKGTETLQKAYALLQNTPVNFIGNIEARDIPFGIADVIVCDGFAGNIALKMLEGMGVLFLQAMHSWFPEPSFYDIDEEIRGKIIEFQKQMDYTAEGGGVLLGVSKPVVKAHGNSNEKAFFNAIRQAAAYTGSNVTDKLELALQTL